MPEIPLTVRRRDHRYVVRVDDMPVAGLFAEIEASVPAGSYVAVVDRRVASLYDIETLLAGRAGWRMVLADAGEGHKTAAGFIALCESLLVLGVDRKTVLVAIGGGVVGDMAGFAAATLLRGLRSVQVPTTLLAQVDSSVGGKTGVNMAGGKNLLGAFYQPELVLADTVFLSTLPEREYLSGIAETAKYGVIGDRDFFLGLAASSDELASRSSGRLAAIVAHCCRMKAHIVGDDELEAEGRRLLNLGHTFGHALEALAGYDGSLLHGEAVSIGMIMAAAYAVEEGVMAVEEAGRMGEVFRKIGLPRRIGEVMDSPGAAALTARLASDDLPAVLLQDKKAAAGGMTVVLPVRIGECRIIESVPVGRVADSMRKQCAV